MSWFLSHHKTRRDREGQVPAELDSPGLPRSGPAAPELEQGVISAATLSGCPQHRWERTQLPVTAEERKLERQEAADGVQVEAVPCRGSEPQPPASQAAAKNRPSLPASRAAFFPAPVTMVIIVTAATSSSPGQRDNFPGP